MHNEFAEILENVPIPTFVIDRNHVVRYWNRACEEFTGIKKEEIIGTSNHWMAFFSKPMPLLADIVLDGVEEFYRKRKVKKRKIKKIDESTYELELYLPHVKKWVYFRAALLRDESGSIGAVETMEDLTERKLMEDEIKRLSELYRIIGEAVNKAESIEQLSYIILRKLREMIGFDMGEVFVYDEKENVLKAAVRLGFETITDHSEVLDVKPDNPSIAVQAAIKREPVLVSDVKKDERTTYIRESCAEDDMGEIFAFPLITRDMLHGVVQIVNRGDRKISKRDIKLLEDVSEQIAAGMAKIKAEEELRRSEELYRGVFESSMDVIYLTTPEGKVIDVNRAAEELFGYTKDELLKMRVEELYANPEKRGEFIDKLERDGFVRNIEMIYRRKDGRIVHCLESAVLLKEGTSTIYHGIIKDITERRKMEEEIKGLSELYRLVGEAVNKSESIEELASNLIQNLMRALNFDMGEILIYDGNMLRAVTQVGFSEEFGKRSAKIQRITPESKSTAVVTALKMESLYVPDMKTSKYTEHFHDLCIKCDLNEMYSVPLVSGGELQGVMQLIVKSGKSFTEEDRKLIDTISKHMAAGIAKIRACEERLKERKRYIDLFESSMDAIILTDVDGKIVEVNRAAEELFGYTKDELAGMDISTLYADPSIREALVEEFSRHGFVKNFEVRYRTKSSGIINCLESSTILRDENGDSTGYHKVIKDITERKRMENNLRKLNKLLQISRDINQFIVREKKKRVLMREACKSFREFEDYLTVWAGIVNKGTVHLVATAGRLNRRLLKRYLEVCLPCVEEVLKARKAKLVKRGDAICANCPMKKEHRFMQTLVIPLLYEGEVQGILSFNSPIPKIFGADELSLLLDLADDLGFALKAIEIEKERKAALKQLRENIEQFEYLADKLRNPLAIMRGYLDLRDEVSIEVTLKEISTQITRIQRLLDELRRMERKTFKLKELLNGKVQQSNSVR